MKTLLFSLFFQLLICCHLLQVSEGKKMLLEEGYLVACSTCFGFDHHFSIMAGTSVYI